MFCPSLHSLTSYADLTPKGNVTSMVNTVGVIVDVKCYSGYKQGTGVSTCLISGVWHPQTPRCDGNHFWSLLFIQVNCVIFALNYLFKFTKVICFLKEFILKVAHTFLIVRLLAAVKSLFCNADFVMYI